MSEVSSAIGKHEEKKSFFQSSLHNRKIELTLSQNAMLKVETNLSGMLSNLEALTTILQNLSTSIFQSLELTWI